MKTDTNCVLNKIISYAFDNLLLDPLDEVYTLNRLATVCGVPVPVRDESCDYGDATLGELLDELGKAVDKTAIADILMPMPRTVNMRFTDLSARSMSKAFDFLYELYAHCDDLISAAPAFASNGFCCYTAHAPAPALVSLPAVGAAYSPISSGNKTACFACEDILAEDVLSREAAFVGNYGGGIAIRQGDTEYFTAQTLALAEAQASKQIADGSVKVALLDYPVPALAFNGIAKNAVMREVARVLKAAAAKELKPVIAAAAKNGVTFYLVFAGLVEPDGYLVADTPLTACGVFAVGDYSPVLPVLAKGTALSTDLSAFKPVYDAVGGVKHGAKAADALGGLLVDKIKPALAAAATVSPDEAVALTATE